MTKKEYIDSRIAKTEYIKTCAETIYCKITLDNGFAVYSDFLSQNDALVDKKAHDEAYTQLYRLFDFLQTEEIYQDSIRKPENNDIEALAAEIVELRRNIADLRSKMECKEKRERQEEINYTLAPYNKWNHLRHKIESIKIETRYDTSY
jgi:hypothetical protein